MGRGQLGDGGADECTGL